MDFKSNYDAYRITERFVRNNRWFVRLSLNGTTKTLPLASYNWLKYNPSFLEIPKGYVIHHLDYDSLNDDPSNLALMGKYQHSAHHWKQKNVETIVKLDEALGLPIQKPKIYYRKDRNVYYLHCKYRKDGKVFSKHVMNLDGTGKNFKTRKQAEQAIERIYPLSFWQPQRKEE